MKKIRNQRDNGCFQLGIGWVRDEQRKSTMRARSDATDTDIWQALSYL